jgi:hypothetical protein
MIGFVPEDHAVDLAPLLDSGHKYIARVKKVLTGGRSPIPVAVVDVYRSDSATVGNGASEPSKKASSLGPSAALLFTQKASEPSKEASSPGSILRFVIALAIIGLLIRLCSG